MSRSIASPRNLRHIIDAVVLRSSRRRMNSASFSTSLNQKKDSHQDSLFHRMAGSDWGDRRGEPISLTMKIYWSIFATVLVSGVYKEYFSPSRVVSKPSVSSSGMFIGYNERVVVIVKRVIFRPGIIASPAKETWLKRQG